MGLNFSDLRGTGVSLILTPHTKPFRYAVSLLLLHFRVIMVNMSFQAVGNIVKQRYHNVGKYKQKAF